MRTIAHITAFLALLSFGQGAEYSSWESRITHKDFEKELRALPKITVQKVVQNTSLSTVVLLVENRTEIDIDYYGYGKDRPQIFIKEKRDGKWVATAWNWCGTGMDRHVLKSRRTGTFAIQVFQGPIQVFTILRNAKDPKEFSLVKLYEDDGG